ncbi:tyrosine-type recombinase/integrase [Candidatus Nitrotoga sp. 1052]|uniref:tyrosine-type recombinase/integrase n=1 Tax=Candidatus Nitrotoga sp. 1052 TaxID=2886964 RepID=UPI001EF48393|nr:integrase family protein [Candidatus Nitrotoga sp. 1052]
MAKVKEIIKAEKVKLTAGRIAGFECPREKPQTFLWSNDPLGLAVRAYPSGAKAFIFQAKVKGQTMRLTIGDVKAWGIAKAEAEARRLQILIDNGEDPRQVIADAIVAKEVKAAALVMQEARETVTVGTAWGEYIKATKSAWGTLHLRDHEKAMQAGGEKRTRSKKLTAPGALASLATIRLVDITPELMTEWAKVESAKRPARTRNARTLFSTFLNWCAAHPTYKAIVTSNAAQSKDVRKHISKAKPKNDALQREQLPAWFAAVKQIGNPAISAYVQAMLLTGARPNELITVRWADVDLQWNSLTIKDKVEGMRVIPLTPYVAHLIAALPRRNEWVFSSLTSASGHLVEPRIAHDKACAVAGLNVTLHGLRRSFASLCEWIEMPAGIGAQIQGHKPQGVREQHYIRRPLDLLRMWHVKIEAWILEQAEVGFVPIQAGLRMVASKGKAI